MENGRVSDKEFLVARYDQRNKEIYRRILS